MQSSTDAGKDGTRKYTAPQQKQQQQQQQESLETGAGLEGATNQTTSFTINGNNPQPTTNTPSKNPFKQQLESSQQNGNTDTECGIMGLGKEQLPPVPPYIPRPMTAGQQPPPDPYRQEDPRAAGTWSAAKSWMVSWRGSNRLVLVIVAIALLLDNMLLTTVGKWQPNKLKYKWNK